MKRFWQKKNRDGKVVFKFELHGVLGESRGSMRKDCCVVDDVSKGKENMPVSALNGVDDDKLLIFTYITSISYPERCKKSRYIGYGCISCCSNSRQCLCALKNRGQLAFNEKETVVR